MNGHEKVNILLVDDQPAKLLSYEVTLGELGENLIMANSAKEALEHLLKKDIAVILIDVVMPDLDGFELAKMIREHPRFQQTALIFVSAIMLTELDRLRGYELGAVDYVPVPVVPELLRAKVRVFAELYRKTRQLERLNAELEARVHERTLELERANAELEARVEQRTREHEAALAQLHEMQKLESLGQLTGGVAHDFNNLLAAVMGNLDLLSRRLAADPAAGALIDGALKAAERGATLTKRMLAFARRQELKPEAVDVPRLFQGMTEMLRRSLDPIVQIVAEFQPGLAPIRVDPNQLELALLNLTLNARDAMPAGGRITIRARPEAVDAEGSPGGLKPGGYVVIGVADTGTGMDEAVLKRATEPFFTTKESGRGTGLGLSMVHGFAAQSGGLLRIESVVGAGTTVELWLPVASEDAAAQAVPARPVPVAATRQCRVLVVDDDPMVLASTSAMIEDLGHAVIRASSAIGALTTLRSEPSVDLVITDHAMPGLTGTELARLIRQVWPELPIVLVTGYLDLPPENHGLPRLSKPFLQQDLAAQIEALIPDRPRASNVVTMPRRA